MKSAMGLCRTSACVPLVILILSAVCNLKSAGADDFVLSSGDEAAWYRGNLHTHTLWSDGDHYPEVVALWYREHGYHFLTFTDHNTLHDHERWVLVKKTKGGLPAFEQLKEQFPADWPVVRDGKDGQEIRLKTFDETFDELAVPGRFLLIQGEEVSDRFNRRPIHLCVSNLTEVLPPMGGESIADVIQNNVDQALARRERSGRRTMVHLNHPNFTWAITAEDFMQIRGERFFELYNGHPGVRNSGDAVHASTERMWDIVNSFRLGKFDLPLMYGLATDDGHVYTKPAPARLAQPGRGWVQVLAAELDPDVLTESMEEGRFYSSSGVTLDRIEFSGNTLSVRVAAEPGLTYRIDFIGTRRGFDMSSESATPDPDTADLVTRVYSDEVGAALKSAENVTQASYQCDGDELYVRAVVTSSRMHPNPSKEGEFERAWVQPVIPGHR